MPLPSWAIVLIVFAVLIVVIGIVLVTWVISVYNSLIKLRNSVEEAFSTMDVYLKKRHDLIPNLVETVKGYAKHEKETLQSVIEARSSCLTATSTAAKVEKENVLTQTLGKMLRLTEKYPELKANTSYLKLQGELSSIEEEIVDSRKYYNGCVKKLNNKIEVFPSCLIAKKFNFEKSTLFQLDNVDERKNPQVKF